MQSEPFRKYKKEIKKFSPEWRNISFPIEIIKEKYEKVEIIEHERDRESTIFAAKNQALAGILKEIDPEAVILDTQYEIIDEDNDQIQIRVLFRVEENIAKKAYNDL